MKFDKKMPTEFEPTKGTVYVDDDTADIHVLAALSVLLESIKVGRKISTSSIDRIQNIDRIQEYTGLS